MSLNPNENTSRYHRSSENQFGLFSNLLNVLRLPMLFLGIAVFFSAERYFPEADYYRYLKWSGLGLVKLGLLSSLFLVLIRQKQNLIQESRCRLYSCAWQVLVLVSLICYLSYKSTLGTSFTPESFLTKTLLAAWVMLGVIALFLAIGTGWSIHENGKGLLAEPKRVLRSTYSWLLIGMLLCALIGYNFFGSKNDKSFDWTYLKISSPSQSTHNMLQNLDEKIRFSLFYPKDNEVLPYLTEYFSQLENAHKDKVEINYFDKDLNPTKAEELKVTGNGKIICQYKDKSEQLDIGTRLATARNKLRKLDSEVQQKYLVLTQARSVVYFSVGHGELSSREESPLRSTQLLEKVLRTQNFGVRNWGLNEGNGAEIPDDASLVIITGPSRLFLPEEVATLDRYVRKGGKLLVLLDVLSATTGVVDVKELYDSEKNPLLKFLKNTGIEFVGSPLTNERRFVSISKESHDRRFLFTNNFTSHESMSTLAQREEKAVVLTFSSGYLKVTPKVNEWLASETLRSMDDTYADNNNNLVFDSAPKGDEKQQSYTLGAASTFTLTQAPPQTKDPSRPEPSKTIEGRILVTADSNIVSDLLIRNQGNLVWILDSIKWLSQKPELMGEISSEEDKEIRHTKEEDIVWFHSTIFAAPILLLIAGYFGTRREKNDNV